MTGYIGLTGGILLLGLLLVGHGRLSRQIYPFVFWLLFTISAFRFQVGCDWVAYRLHFEIAGRTALDVLQQLRDPGWWLILGGLHRLNIDYLWVNVISSAVCFAGLHLLARRQPNPSGYFALLLPVLLVNMPMSGIRQGVAIGLITAAFVQFVNGRAVFFLVLVLLAASIHSSAILFAVLTPLAARRISGLRLFCTGFIAVPGAVLILHSDAGQLAGERYIGSGTDAFGAQFRVLLLGLTGAFFLIALRKRWRRQFPQDYRLALLGAQSMLALAFLLPVSTVIADRLGYYLIAVQAMILVRIASFPGLPLRNLWALLPYIGLFLFFGSWAMQSRHFSLCYLPYRNWLWGLR